MEKFDLDCPECGKVTRLDVQQQHAILNDLTRPSHAAILECECRRFQFILRVRSRKLQEAA